MDHVRDTDTPDDLSALAWVHEELRRTLEAAHKSLRRYLRESESTFGSDVDVVDPSVLRAARAQLHQGVGALELVGLPAAAAVLRASEAAVQRFSTKGHAPDSAAVDIIEKASFALLDYLGRRLAGKPVSALAMFPQYRAVQELAGADRIHPADLWSFDWSWRELPIETAVLARPTDAAARGELESLLLGLMRGDATAAARMSELFASLAAGTRRMHERALWQLAAAFFEGQSQGLIRNDVYTKRVASRLLAQVRICERGDGEVSERLAQDLLFFCAQATSPGGSRSAPRLAAVRAQHGLAHMDPVDYEQARLGRYDPAWVLQARKRVAGAKDAWSAVAAAELHRLTGLVEQFSLVGDSLRRLFPSGEVLAESLHEAVLQTTQANAAPSPELAMEVATAVLYVEAALEDADFDHPEQGERVRRLAERVASARRGTSAGPLEPWMEELYRRVSDRQTMGSVVQELRSSLSEAEKLIDQFFRNPVDRQPLIPVPGQLSAMRGVLSVLGMDQASQAVLRMRDEIDALIVQPDFEPAAAATSGRFERLAGNLGALGFLIDMLSVQPQLAKSLFVYDSARGTLAPVMGRNVTPSGFGALEGPAPVEPRLIEQALSLAVSAASDNVPVEDVARELERMSNEALVADQPSLAAAVTSAQEALATANDDAGVEAAREQLAEALTDFVATASEPVGLEPEVQELRATPVAAPAAPAGPTGLEEDDEMRDVFLEEAREVIGGAYDALGALSVEPGDIEQLTTVRRAFHTLKGSSRMVGLADFGEAAWACEQLYNARLAEAPQADEALQSFSSQALAYLGDWVEAIAARRDGGHAPAMVRAAADALRLEGRSVPLSLPSAVEVVLAPPPAAEPPVEAAGSGLERVPLDFGTTSPQVFMATPQPSVPAELPKDLPSVADLELPSLETAGSALQIDLRGLDHLPAAAPPAPVPAARPVAEETEDAEVEKTRPLPLLDDALPEPPPPPESIEMIDLDLLAEAPPEPAPAALPSDTDPFKVVGPLRISIPLFNIYLNEADELSRRLSTEVAEWSHELERPVGETPVALAHSLAGSSATVGFQDLSHLARQLEHALMRSNRIGRGTPDEAQLFGDAAEEIRRLLHQFAAGFLKSPPDSLLQRLEAHEIESARRLEALATAPEPIDEFNAPFMPSTTATEPVERPEVTELPAEPARVTQPAELAPVAATALGTLGVAELRSFTDLPETAAAVTVEAREKPEGGEDDIDAVDAVDAELFPIFEEEGQELLPQLAARMRDWHRKPSDPAGASACMRTLHTLKGGARLAGAMRLGEMAHRLETAIERLLARGDVTADDVDALHGRVDALSATFEALRARDAAAYAQATAAAEAAAPAVAELPAAPVVEPAPAPVVVPPAPMPEAVAEPPVEATFVDETAPEAPEAGTAAEAPAGVRPAEIDWSRFASASTITVHAAPQPVADRRGAERPGSAAGVVRVRAPLLERLVNHAGEVSITRSRLESEVSTIRSSLGDLNDNLERLRRQLRDIELQAETQIASRMEAARAAAQSFDPLEMDRFTRFQELTRMMAESVNDVATVQRTLAKTLQSAEDELAAQARLTRDLQDDLLRTRMVEFDGLSDRLYRVVRQAAKETGKQVRLDIVGGNIEVDRGVLERMTGSFEHLLRNCVTHGIEPPEARSAAGKESTGAITVALTHEGNEVGIEFRDDGSGLDLERIRARGVAMGLLDPQAQPGEAELANLIFTPGFSTAETVTELAGRGIGMDVVRSEVAAMGGRIETATAPGRGTSFKLVLPLTTAVTQVVMLRCGTTVVSVPATLVEIVRRAKPQEVDQAYASGVFLAGDRPLPFFWLGALLQASPRSAESGRTLPVVIIRSAQQRIALHVDEVLGNQEVVVKNLGPQLARLPGLAGITLLASGAVALIYNPVALATLYGERAAAWTREALAAPQRVETAVQEPAVAAAPLVLVVDDSLTVRRVTQRLLAREGYRVTVAKDGLDALEKLAEERPAVLLSDIEMPRMDGFDLVRNVRGDRRLSDLPVIMITSRIAQKHRDVATELGVNHYLGKPYSEEELLALVARYATAAVPA